jgi:curved DNA-binding protein CbpA
MPKIRTFYDELGVGSDAGDPEIKRAFRDIAKVYHPDRNPPEKKEWAHEQMSRLNFIMETLLDAKTRTEYDQLIEKYRRGLSRRPRRTARQEYALQREHARISVEIMNLSGKYENCSIKIMLGSAVCVLSMIGVVTMSFVLSPTAITYFYMSFGRFFALIGALMAMMGIFDYIRRGRYQKQISELESRRMNLQRRMYEAWTP